VPHAVGPATPTLPRAARSRAGEPRTHGMLALALGWLGVAMIGLNTVRVGGFAVSDGLFFAMGAVLLVKLLVGDESGLAPPSARRSTHVVLLGAVLLLTASVLSSFQSWNPASSLLISARLGYLTLLWFWMLRAVVPSRRALNALLSAWRWGVLSMAVVALFGQVGLIHVSIENSENRQTAFSGHPNDLGGLLAVGLPILLLNLPLHPEHSPRRATLRRAASVGITVYAITTTGSITAFFAAGVAVIATLGLTTLIPSTDRARRRISPLGVMAGAVVAAVGLVVLSQSDLPVFERIQRFESGDVYLEGSAQHRARLNAAVVNRFDEWMVVGVGMDENSMFAADLFDQTDTYVTGGVHNMYLKVLFEAGLPALIGLLIIQLATLRAGMQLIVNTRHTELYPIAVGLVGALVGACVVALFGPILYHRFFWLPIALIWCLWSLRREELRRPPVAAPVRPAGPAPLAALPPAPQDARPNGRGSAGGPATGSPPSWPGGPGRSTR